MLWMSVSDELRCDEVKIFIVVVVYAREPYLFNSPNLISKVSSSVSPKYDCVHQKAFGLFQLLRGRPLSFTVSKIRIASASDSTVA